MRSELTPLLTLATESVICDPKPFAQKGFGALMQSFKANHYRNKRMGFAATVKSENITEWAGLWMRVEGQRREPLRLDTMYNRRIVGSIDWQNHQVVLDVPDNSITISFGVLLIGTGQIWFRDFKFRETRADPTDIDLEAEKLPDDPRNMDLSEM